MLAITACADRQPASPFAGTWTMTLDGHPFMLITLREGSGGLVGEVSRPLHFTTSDFVRFSGFGPEVATERILSSDVREGRLHFVTADPGDATDISEYEMWRDGDETAQIKLSDVPDTMETMHFARVAGAAPAVFRGWEPTHAYRVGDVKVSNDDMREIFEADQEARQEPGKMSAADWAGVGRKDEERRTHTQQLLASGALHTGEDFTRAAFVFQHGSTPDDYLLAHTLAAVAVGRGDASATWIMTATLDRYLQSIGKSQIYGTQFKATRDATQEPYNRELISDPLRRELGVPTLDAQRAQQQDWVKQFQSAASPGK